MYLNDLTYDRCENGYIKIVRRADTATVNCQLSIVNCQLVN